MTRGVATVAKFDRYMLSQLMVLFGFFSLVLIMVYWVNRAISLFDQLIANGQSAVVFLEFTALTLPNVIRVVLPISAFIASVYVTNRLSTESELVIMQSSGYSSFRLARPVLLFGILVSVMLMILTNFLVPATNRTLAERQEEIAQNIATRFLKEGRFLHPTPGVTFYIREITAAGELQDIYLSDQRDPDQHTTYTARRALLVRDTSGPKLLMFDGLAQVLEADDSRLSTTAFRELTFDLSDLIEPSDSRAPRPREMSTYGLLRNTDALIRSGWNRVVLQVETHDRLAQPLLAIVTALVGFACLLLGGFSRFGVWRQIIVAIMLLVLLKAADSKMADIARSGEGLWPLLYLPALSGTGLACIILWGADKPGLLARRRRGGAAA